MEKQNNIDIKDILVLAGGLGYFILPMDLIPDVLPGIGYSDDSMALYAAFKSAFALFSQANLGKAHEKAKSLLGDRYDEEQIDKFLRQAAENIAKK